METEAHWENTPEMRDATGFIIAPMATAAALDGSVFSKINATDVLPRTWEERARKAWEYYIEEPLVKNCVNSWRSFAVGDDVKIDCDSKDVKYEAVELAARLGLMDFVKDMVLQLLVKGEAVGFKRYAKNNADQPSGDIEEVVCVNPVSVKVKYAHGQLLEMTQYAEAAAAFTEGLQLPVEQVLRLKWDAPSFSPRGNSIVLPAFQSIELLRDYRRAEQAIAKRWTTPFRLLKVGGAFGQKMVMPDQRMLEGVRDMVNKMDLKSGLVVPFYVTVETHGADGEVLNVEDKVKEVKEDIVVALGLSRALVTGDGPNFATATISMRKMMIMIREIKQAARAILSWVFNDWLELKGYQENTLQFVFNDLDPCDAVDFKRLLIELYDRKLISRSSVQLRMDLDPDIEAANRETEKKAVDLSDEKQVKPIVDMVMAGILSVESAQRMLGIVEHTEPGAVAACSAVASWASPPPHTDAAVRYCDGCAHFDETENFCAVHQCERSFDAAACRFRERNG